MKASNKTVLKEIASIKRRFSTAYVTREGDTIITNPIIVFIHEKAYAGAIDYSCSIRADLYRGEAYLYSLKGNLNSLQEGNSWHKGPRFIEEATKKLAEEGWEGILAFVERAELETRNHACERTI